MAQPLFFPNLIAIDPPSKEGLVGVGGELSVPLLIDQYRKGVFPWPQPGLPQLWFSPDPRGLLHRKDLHVPRSLQKLLSKAPWSYSINLAFDQVLRACKTAIRPGQNGTWITDEIERVYIAMFFQGFGFSVEVWRDKVLAGGLYGVKIGNYHCAESMFFRESNASKAAVVHFFNALPEVQWLDTQMITPVVESLGGRLRPKAEFVELLNRALASGLN